jgi:hypothetical protein
MPEDSRDGDKQGAEEVRWPEVPKVPALPETPEYRPNLPPLNRKSPSREQDEEEGRRMGLAYVLPTALIAPVVLLTLVGYWIDQYRGGRDSWFTLGGALLGILSGFVQMIRIANRLNRDE